mmetsp:Transcript_45457/g.105423  ORF Transcript_45457/g.105423 Transcript_45457/m.105423 type:complete len:381 (-) Transcript_45457:57-1199(-)
MAAIPRSSAVVANFRVMFAIWCTLSLVWPAEAQLGALFGSPSPPPSPPPAAGGLFSSFGLGGQQDAGAKPPPTPPPNSLLNDLRTMSFPGKQEPSSVPQAAVGVSAGGGISSMPAAAPRAAVGDQPAPDLACMSEPHAAAWQALKIRFRDLVVKAGTILAPPQRQVIVDQMEQAIEDLKKAGALGTEAKDECGLGKLSLQLVSLATVEDPAPMAQVFSSLETVASPVLTMLLDVSWLVLAQTGWPIFGLLNLINLRKQEIQGGMNPDVLDGLDAPASQAFLGSIGRVLMEGSLPALDHLADEYLRTITSLPPAATPLGQFTALAAHAVARPDLQEKAAFMQVLQDGFRQAVGSAPELDIMISTGWPLWAFIHVASEAFVA